MEHGSGSLVTYASIAISPGRSKRCPSIKGQSEGSCCIDPKLPSTQTFFSVSPPVDSLNIVGVGPSHSLRIDMATGALYRLDPDLRWSRHAAGYRVTNGPAFSPDGCTMYYTDSVRRTVYAFQLETGRPTEIKAFAGAESIWRAPCRDRII